MLHLNTNVTAKKLGKKLGFSLIELLVVVAIIGLLAAVTIPAYNGYRENVALGAFHSTGSNFQRAFLACSAINDIAECDTLTELGMKIGGSISVTSTNNGSVASSDNICVSFQTALDGDEFNGCYHANYRTSKLDSTFDGMVCGCNKTVASVAKFTPNSQIKRCSVPTDCDTSNTACPVVGSAVTSAHSELCQAGGTGTCATGLCT